MPRKKNWKRVEARHKVLERFRAEGKMVARVHVPRPTQSLQDGDLKPPSPPKTTTDTVSEQMHRENPAMATINDLWDYWTVAGNRVTISPLSRVCSKKLSHTDWVFAFFIRDIKLPDGREFDQEHITSFFNQLQNYISMYRALSNRKFVSLNSFGLSNSAYDRKIKTVADYRENDTEINWEMLIDMEMNLWNKNVLGTHSVESLVLTVYFYMMKIFGLYSGDQLCCLKTKDFSFGSNWLGLYVEFMTKDGTTYRQYNDPYNPQSFYQLIQAYIDMLQSAGLENIFLGTVESKDETIKSVEDRKLLFLDLLEVTRDHLTDSEIDKLFSKLRTKAGSRFSCYSIEEIRHWIVKKLKISGLDEDREIESDGGRQIQKCKLLDPPSDLNLRISSLGNVIKFQSLQRLSSQHPCISHEVVNSQPCSPVVKKTIEFVCTRDNKKIAIVCSENTLHHRMDFVCQNNEEYFHSIPFDRKACTMALRDHKSSQFCCAALRNMLVIISKYSVVATERIEHHYYKASRDVARQLLQRNAERMCHLGSQMEGITESSRSTSLLYPVYVIKNTSGETGYIVQIKTEVTERCGNGVILDEDNNTEMSDVTHTVSSTTPVEIKIEVELTDDGENVTDTPQWSTETNRRCKFGEQYQIIDVKSDENELSNEQCSDMDINEEFEKVLGYYRDSLQGNKTVQSNRVIPQSGIKEEIDDYTLDYRCLLRNCKHSGVCTMPISVDKNEAVEIKYEVDDCTRSCDISTRDNGNSVDHFTIVPIECAVETDEIKTEVWDSSNSCDTTECVKHLGISSPLSSEPYFFTQTLETARPWAEQNGPIQMSQNVPTEMRHTVQTSEIAADWHTSISEQTESSNNIQTHKDILPDIAADTHTSIAEQRELSNSVEPHTDITGLVDIVEDEPPEVYIDVDHALGVLH